jgi:hypothetical protein
MLFPLRVSLQNSDWKNFVCKEMSYIEGNRTYQCKTSQIAFEFGQHVFNYVTDFYVRDIVCDRYM